MSAEDSIAACRALKLLNLSNPYAYVYEGNVYILENDFKEYKK